VRSKPDSFSIFKMVNFKKLPIDDEWAGEGAGKKYRKWLAKIDRGLMPHSLTARQTPDSILYAIFQT
jgi:hypothetical protein